MRICLFEDFDGSGLQRSMQRRYEEWERGLIKAWGHVLYLGYHDVPEYIGDKVDERTFREVFLDYYLHGDEDEDMQDWMSDGPPTMNRGRALFDKNRIDGAFSEMSSRTKLLEPLTVYRASESGMPADWNSYSTNKEIAMGHLGVGHDRQLESYVLPVGYGVVFASGLADKDEVIVKIAESDRVKFRVD